MTHNCPSFFTIFLGTTFLPFSLANQPKHPRTCRRFVQNTRHPAAAMIEGNAIHIQLTSLTKTCTEDKKHAHASLAILGLWSNWAEGLIHKDLLTFKTHKKSKTNTISNAKHIFFFHLLNNTVLGSDASLLTVVPLLLHDWSGRGSPENIEGSLEVKWKERVGKTWEEDRAGWSPVGHWTGGEEAGSKEVIGDRL